MVACCKCAQPESQPDQRHAPETDDARPAAAGFRRASLVRDPGAIAEGTPPARALAPPERSRAAVPASAAAPQVRATRALSVPPPKPRRMLESMPSLRLPQGRELDLEPEPEPEPLLGFVSLPPPVMPPAPKPAAAEDAPEVPMRLPSAPPIPPREPGASASVGTPKLDLVSITAPGTAAPAVAPTESGPEPPVLTLPHNSLYLATHPKFIR